MTTDRPLLVCGSSFPSALFGFSGRMTQRSYGRNFEMPRDSLFCSVTRRNSQLTGSSLFEPVPQHKKAAFKTAFAASLIALTVARSPKAPPQHEHHLLQVSSDISSSSCHGRAAGTEPRAEQLNAAAARAVQSAASCKRSDVGPASNPTAQRRVTHPRCRMSTALPSFAS